MTNWIDVKDSLPKDDTSVLAHYKHLTRDECCIGILKYAEEMYRGKPVELWLEPGNTLLIEYDVTHWQPLPEHPT